MQASEGAGDAWGRALLDYLHEREVPELLLETDGGKSVPAMHPERCSSVTPSTRAIPRRSDFAFTTEAASLLGGRNGMGRLTRFHPWSRAPAGRSSDSSRKVSITRYFFEG